MNNNNLTGIFYTVITKKYKYTCRYLKTAIRKLKQLENNNYYNDNCIQIRLNDYSVNNENCVIGSSSLFILAYKHNYDIFPNATNYYKTTDEYKKLYSAADEYLKECK